MDKQLAKRLVPLVKDQALWGAFLEWVRELQTQAQQELETGISEQGLYRSQGKMNSLRVLESLPKIVAQKIKEEVEYD